MSVNQVPRLIGELYKITDQLNRLFDRPFTPDGHLVGSIGEVVAAYVYDLKLERCSHPGWDAKTQSDQSVEIKLRGGKRINVSQQDRYADNLIVLRLMKPLCFEEVYAGKFPKKLLANVNFNKRKFVTVGIPTLRRLNCHELGAGTKLNEINRAFYEFIHE